MAYYKEREDREKKTTKLRYKNLQQVYEEKEKEWRIQRAFLLVAVILLLAITVGVILLFRPAEQPATAPLPQDFTPAEFTVTKNAKTIKIPAVDNEGKGVPVKLIAEARPGNGRVLVDVESLFFFVDTQNSIRNARNVASRVSGIDTNKYDLLYVVEANASAIGGPSAGAALTIATMAALQNITIRDDVMITGSINHDGTLGPVSGIIEKASAAKQVGATLFLVPLTQGIEVSYETQRFCEKVGPAEICTIEQIPRKVSVQEQVGIKVLEVATVNEALEQFLKG